MKTYGILKIANNWCQDELDTNNLCNIVCSDLQTEDVTETAKCASHIFLVSGDSFIPWYPAFQEDCMNNDTTFYTSDCAEDLTIRSSQTEFYLTEGDTNVKINCSVVSYPSPRLRWEWEPTGDDELISSTTHPPEDIMDIEFVATLSFSEVKLSHSGTYTCHAEKDDSMGRAVDAYPFQVIVNQVTSPTTDGSGTDSTSDPTESTFEPTTDTLTSSLSTTTDSSDSSTSTLPTTKENTDSPTTESLPTTESSETTEESLSTILSTSIDPTSSTIPSSSFTETTLDLGSSSTAASTVMPTSTTSDMTARTSVNPADPTTPSDMERIYLACEIAQQLTYLHKDNIHWGEHIEDWLCLSDVTTRFNGSYLAADPDHTGRFYYGIFKISNEWCQDDHNTANPCNISCNDLFHNDFDVEKSASCSKYIFAQKTFTEWPEFAQLCENVDKHYLVNCSVPPFFTSDTEDETNKVFKEFDENKNITCSAVGYPPPELSWDFATLNHILNSGRRLRESKTVQKISDGNWTVQSTIIFNEVRTKDDAEYICVAENSASSKTLRYIVTVVPSEQGWKETLIIGGSLTLGLLGLLAIPAMYLIYKMRAKRKRILHELYQQFKYGQESIQPVQSTDLLMNFNPDAVSYLSRSEYAIYQGAINLPFPKALEILPYRLEIMEYTVLGRGAFGIVFLGRLDNRVTIAVKTVPKDADESKLAALLSEVKIMNFVGRHPNIVQLLGVQFIDLKKGIVYVAVEFCTYGSLEGVLHEKRRRLAMAESYLGKIYNIPGYIGLRPAEKPFELYQLLKFSHQVCCAMEFLASKRIIHGDLAARNVLVDSNFNAKISDFGLSRQLYDTCKTYVVETKESAMPWRWCAIEILKYKKFSTESDIWAYGVFMWEVFSLAEVPYTEGISWGPDFVKYLERGFRLGIPPYANQEIYQLMKKCWEAQPSKRIGFQQLSVQVLTLLETEYKKQS
ncbi:Fibroblast growth factor receptor 3 [Folsomia candida]|uniref:Fibroblast growth factor receptor 3 n=2 Tax=Folsomia candida TaxID=158441 RepID=A0A226EBM1_FOLCA|nr:Fibroblast growth factor receptor 3 [Folsomia candida]